MLFVSLDMALNWTCIACVMDEMGGQKSLYKSVDAYIAQVQSMLL